tara:strand:+ start:54 stop:581 length:528 start_codon:yes stop_codon:yes gene_type:complete
MIKVTNRTRDIVTLPAPYQGILMAYRSEVLDTTEAEFITAIGGLDTAGGVFTIESVGASESSTVTKDTALGGGGGAVNAVESASTGSSGTPLAWPADATVLISTATSPRYLQLPAISATTEQNTYVIKDGAGNAATHNITVSALGGDTIADASATITSNHGSLSFAAKGTKWYVI